MSLLVDMAVQRYALWDEAMSRIMLISNMGPPGPLPQAKLIHRRIVYKRLEAVKRLVCLIVWYEQLNLWLQPKQGATWPPPAGEAISLLDKSQTEGPI
jgi:hypothetical protein